MRQRFTLHLALIFALLFAQQAGFAHALSHLAQPQAAGFHAPAIAPGQAPLPEHARHQVQACAQCLVVTLADGAIASRSAIVAVATIAALPAAPANSRFTQHTAAPFLARAPPVLA